MAEPEFMTQRAPFPTALAELVRRWRYRPGWHFSLAHEDRGQGCEGLTLTILVVAPNALRPAEPIRVRHLHPVPAAAYDQRSWLNWLMDRCLDTDRHEGYEFGALALEGVTDLDGRELTERPFKPLHGPGNDPYLRFLLATPEERQTSCRGERSPRDD